MPILVDEQVLRLQITVDHSMRVDMIESDQDLQEIKLGLLLRHLLHFLELVEELSSWAN